jgi:PAS domain S-box-containing protein
MDELIRLLIVEDSDDDATLLVRVLRHGGYTIIYEVVDTPAAMQAALEREDWDIITSDHAMPCCSASEALALAKKLRPDLPFIIVSGQIDLNLAVTLMKAGAQDYVQKRELERIIPVIQRELREMKAHRERQRAEDLLKISENRNRRLFETAQDGILILDADMGQIIDVNPFLTEMLGYSQAYFFGKKLWETAPFKNSDPFKFAFTQTSNMDYIRYDNLRLETSDGRLIDVEFIVNIYFIDHTKVAQCNIRDMSMLKLAEAEILKLNIELEKRAWERTLQFQVLNQELDTFNYSVSHDLRAPLNRISGFVSDLLKGHANKQNTESLEIIQHIRASVNQMNTLIDVLFELANIFRHELERQTVDLSALVHQIADELQQKNPVREVEFRITEGITTYGDPQLMRIVLENLLGNAWKFSNQRVIACIEFGIVPQTDGCVTYFVRDNGVGFDMIQADQLFAPFQRLHNDNEFPGSGIGLATVKRIIHHHGGRVWATSTQGKGASFYFTIGDC